MNTVSETTRDTIDSRLREMLDHYEITRTLKQYCFACDRGDEARMAAVYLDDSWDEHGVYAARGPDFARIMSQAVRSEEHTSELQSLMRISYAVFCLKKQIKTQHLKKHIRKDITT